MYKLCGGLIFHSTAVRVGPRVRGTYPCSQAPCFLIVFTRIKSISLSLKCANQLLLSVH